MCHYNICKMDNYAIFPSGGEDFKLLLSWYHLSTTPVYHRFSTPCFLFISFMTLAKNLILPTHAPFIPSILLLDYSL